MRQGSQKSGFVYIASCPPLLRIGFSSNPEKRLRSLIMDIPLSVKGISDSVELIAFAAHKQSEERWLHIALKAFHHSGSWYVDCRELRAELRSRGFEIPLIDRPFLMPEEDTLHRDRMAAELKGWK